MHTQTLVRFQLVSATVSVAVVPVLCYCRDHCGGNRQLLRAFPDLKIYGSKVDKPNGANWLETVFTLS